ncbi:carnitine dehydratase [Gordonia sp. 852002-50816_SCH5313054-c]|uniref:CaiB/BaiF CoA transferase family protein n=1 Tax=unclassified Gordonia (in: high G+C Gram-positive bacteria) TaxID=2657482 RepID=UPI0007E9998B|nr:MULTISPECIES: CaiB/BaiF CoA-transferase family protein [unclassified Gordonia (in: high G+C Gram-positive bacteria)]OBC08215.1 carnitine dehydratase [Gordonia sp. 852002-50816_SCH5313054-a]OBC19496.1 carnitine dehydratase [Gordonia sp. 852002-50816_SCH5313054-c]
MNAPSTPDAAGRPASDAAGEQNAGASSKSVGTGGPLNGVRVVEFAGIGPGPHAAMMLADLGADVIRIQRPGQLPDPARNADALLRGRRVVEANLKDPADREEILRLIGKADVLLEGFRPGVMERLGFGPSDLESVNERLVYGRMTGWGQEGPRAPQAGHDINYISLTGMLHAIGRAGERPVPPMNLVGDFGGGSMFLVMGVLAALVERASSGRGQVVDAAMVDGASVLGQMIWAFRGTGLWSDEQGTNMLDTGAPYYEVYETSDGKYMAAGAIEPQFYAEMLRGLGLTDADLPGQNDVANWPKLRQIFTETFASRTRDEWAKIFDGTDACVSPVLTFAEAPDDPHMAARANLVEIDGVRQAQVAPRFSRTAPSTPRGPDREAVDAATVWTD